MWETLDFIHKLKMLISRWQIRLLWFYTQKVQLGVYKLEFCLTRVKIEHKTKFWNEIRAPLTLTVYLLYDSYVGWFKFIWKNKTINTKSVLMYNDKRMFNGGADKIKIVHETCKRIYTMFKLIRKICMHLYHTCGLWFICINFSV